MIKFLHFLPFRRFLSRKKREWELDHNPARVIQREWTSRFGYAIDWDNPRDINEKILWLICFSDTSEWTRLADKVKVRDYVAEKGYGDILVPLLGTWKHASEIPWGSLPEKFVLKCNHDCGSTHIIDANTDHKAISIALDKALKRKYGYCSGEMHYNGIDPCILAEPYLDCGDALPVDYKVWCFDGDPYCIMTCSGRTSKGFYLNVYDLDWNLRKGVCVFSDHFSEDVTGVPKPLNLKKMLDAASCLSKGFPEVRVDFYEVQGRLYFGEMTFSSLAGRMSYFTDAFLKELGDQIKLPGLDPKTRV